MAVAEGAEEGRGAEFGDVEGGGERADGVGVDRVGAVVDVGEVVDGQEDAGGRAGDAQQGVAGEGAAQRPGQAAARGIGDGLFLLGGDGCHRWEPPVGSGGDVHHRGTEDGERAQSFPFRSLCVLPRVLRASAVNDRYSGAWAARRRCQPKSGRRTRRARRALGEPARQAGERGLLQAEGEGGVDVDSAGEVGEAEAVFHGDRDLIDRLPGVGADEVRAEDAAPAVVDEFHEAVLARLARGQGAVVVAVGEAGDGDVVVLSPRLLLGRADAADLGEVKVAQGSAR